MATTRAVSAVFAGWGAVQLLAPERTVRTLTPDVPEPRAWIVRLLGARMVVQHGLVLVHPTRAVVLVGSAVDALHALSMVPLLLGHRWRRPALVSAGSAASSALAQLATAPAAPPA